MILKTEFLTSIAKLKKISLPTYSFYISPSFVNDRI